MIGEAEIIVGAHVEHAFAISDTDVRVLRSGDDSLRFVQTLRFNFFQRPGEPLFEFAEHVKAQINAGFQRLENTTMTNFLLKIVLHPFVNKC
jgi:hypothetical protein